MLSGKIALIIGASRGIGAGIARELAAQDAHVILAARTLNEADGPRFGPNGPKIPGSLNKQVFAIRSAGGKASAHPVDLLDHYSIKQLIDCVSRDHGKVDLLVNCAMGFPGRYSGSILDHYESHWNAMMEVGVRGKYLAIHEVAKIMVPQKVGLIVNISAGASKINYYHPLFRMAMAAVDRLTEATAFDLKDTGVSCLSIWPRWVRTEWMLMANDNSDLGIEVSETDLGESDSPEFTGRAIAHLAADPKVKARSGEIIPVVALAHEYGFDDLDGTRPPMDEFTQDWSGRLKQLRAITTR